MQVAVSPLIGRMETQNADNAVERLLDRQARDLLTLRIENERLASHRPSSPPPRITYGADGKLVVVDGDAPPEARVDESLQGVSLLRAKMSPLTLDVSTTEPERVNLLLPELDSRHMFGGYITKLQMAIRLAKAGERVRIVVVDPPREGVAADLRAEIAAYEGIGERLDLLEVSHHGERAAPLIVSPADVFLATTWWTAHIAHDATRELRHSRFVYLIQEYEPFTFPMGSFAAMARHSYDLPHLAVFSTRLLHDYFRANRIGVYSNGANGDTQAIDFQNSITEVGEIHERQLADRSPRLLFYARPSATEARNLFELGIMALSEAIDLGVLEDTWRFTGVGGPKADVLRLSGNATLKMLPRQPVQRYRALLRGHDLGLSLMYTPHPSLVPIEMASAGMLVVTNTFESKTAERLTDISANIIPCEPSVDGVCGALRAAKSRLPDLSARVAGARVAWSRSPDESFDTATIGAIRKLVASVRD
jgi:hypothetical protein